MNYFDYYGNRERTNVAERVAGDTTVTFDQKLADTQNNYTLAVDEVRDRIHQNRRQATTRETKHKEAVAAWGTAR